jgi:hypothetical protein
MQLRRDAALLRRSFDRDTGSATNSDVTRAGYIDQLREAGDESAADRLEAAWQDQVMQAFSRIAGKIGSDYAAATAVVASSWFLLVRLSAAKARVVRARSGWRAIAGDSPCV